MAIISFLPDWLVLIFFGVILYVIYYNLPEETKSGVKKFLMEYGVYVVIFLIWLYWKSQTGSIYESPDKWPANVNRATFFCGLGVLVFILVKSWLYEFRYYTHHFTADNISGSCHRYHEIGNVGEPENNWAVFFLGGSGTSDERFVFPWPWIKKVVVVPKCSVQFLGNQIIAFSQVDKVDINDLPEDVRDFIENDNFGRWVKDKIYFGLWDVQKKARSPKYVKIESELKKANHRINELADMLKGKLSRTKAFISDTLAMTDKVRGKDWRDRQNNPPPGSSGD